MLRFTTAAGLAAMAILASAPASGAAPRFVFDCDAPEGHNSAVTAMSGDTVHLGAMVNPVAARPGKIPPNAGIVATSADGRSMVALQLLFPKADATAYTLQVVGRRQGQPFQRVLGQLQLSGKVGLGIGLDARGKGQAIYGENAIPVDLAGPGPWRVQAFCASGQFRFDDLAMTPS